LSRLEESGARARSPAPPSWRDRASFDDNEVKTVTYDPTQAVAQRDVDGPPQQSQHQQQAKPQHQQQQQWAQQRQQAKADHKGKGGGKSKNNKGGKSKRGKTIGGGKAAGKSQKGEGRRNEVLPWWRRPQSKGGRGKGK